MSVYLIPITGRLVDPLGSGISGASVYFTSKATTRGPENVVQSADAAFTSDASGFYNANVASGWYKLYYVEPSSLEPVKIGVATVSGVGALDLGTLIDNSIPPPSLLQNISNVDSSGLANGSLLVYNSSRQKWVTTIGTGGLGYATTTALASMSGVYDSSYAPFPIKSGHFAITNGPFRYLWTGAAGTSGATSLPNPAQYGGQSFTIKNISASNDAILVISGSIDYVGDYLLYGGGCATVMSDTHAWVLTSTAFCFRITV